MASRVWAYLASALLIGAMCVPFSWPLHRDSFPLSNYPMFSRPLPDPSVTITYALGIEPGGARHHLPPKLVANED